MTTEVLPAEIKISYDQFRLSSLISWVECNGYKPHLIIHTEHPGVRLPADSMKKEFETINVSSTAVVKAQWFEDRLEFNARFSGMDYRLVIPYHAVKAVAFAGTNTAIPMPWHELRITGQVEGVDNRPSSLVEAPPENVPEVQTDHNVGRGLIDPILHDEAPPTTNVRTVDFRAPRKPKP